LKYEAIKSEFLFYWIYKTWSSGPGQNQMALPLSFVPKNTKPKHQITNKSQIPISNDQNLTRQDIVWIFEFWSLDIV
jgi:hypothetical protein